MTARPTARPIATPLARPVTGAGEGGAPVPLLLDTQTGAIAAYSIRKLLTSFSGSTMRLRRSSDNTEQDIGFANNTLNTASALSFCGSGSGFSTRWDDQIGGFNALQGTTTLQPRLVNSGVIGTGLEFDGAGDFSQATHASGLNVGTGPMTFCAWVNTTQTGFGAIAAKFASNTGFVWYKSDTGRQLFFFGDGSAISGSSNTVFNDGNWHHVAVSVNRSGNATFYLDGVADGFFPVSMRTGSINNTQPLEIGAFAGGQTFGGRIYEFLFFNVAKSAADIAEIHASLEL